MSRTNYIRMLTLLRELLDWQHPVNSPALQFHLIQAGTIAGLLTETEHVELTRECRNPFNV